MTKVSKWLSEYLGPILVGAFIVIVIGTLAYMIMIHQAQKNRTVEYCYSIELPDLYYVRRAYYCVGIREGSSVVIPVPDSVLRKE